MVWKKILGQLMGPALTLDKRNSGQTLSRSRDSEGCVWGPAAWGVWEGGQAARPRRALNMPFMRSRDRVPFRARLAPLGPLPALGLECVLCSPGGPLAFRPTSQARLGPAPTSASHQLFYATLPFSLWQPDLPGCLCLQLLGPDPAGQAAQRQATGPCAGIAQPLCLLYPHPQPLLPLGWR